jgi:hypothetical protein
MSLLENELFSKYNNNNDNKSKDISMYVTKAYVGVEALLHLFLTSALLGGE